LSNDNLTKLIELMARLRSPDGCSWDRAQDYDSMKGLLTEEAYEVVDAVNARDFDALEDELGDLLFQVVFYSRLAEEDGRFTLESVMARLSAKLVRRHPHVFGTVRARTPEEALKSWNLVKEQEREVKREGLAGAGGEAGRASGDVEPLQGSSQLDGMAKTLPCALQAYEMGVRAAEVGFDWPDTEGVLDKAQEEIAELRRELQAAGNGKPAGEDRARIEDEIGDLLFSLSQLARHVGSDPESCLRRSNRKFQRRFQALERAVARRGLKLTDCSPGELEAIWTLVKAEEGEQTG
jgi:nucleoside triphosphate diphosphatase